MSVGEKRRITRRFIAALGDDIGPHTDIPAPDMYTDAETMAWIYDTYQMMHPDAANLGVVTGKPLDLGGIPGRGTATAQGLAYVLERLLALGEAPALSGIDGQPRRRSRGSATPGATPPSSSREMGATHRGRQRHPGRGRRPQRPQPRAGRGAPQGHRVGGRRPRHAAAGRQGPLEVECDILIPAALENQITLENARAGQGPAGRRSGQRADHARRRSHPRDERGIVVVPDILANAGGVVVSYFEWVQNLDNEQWDEHVVQERLRAKMQRATEGVVNTYHHLDHDYAEYRERWRKAAPGRPDPALPDLRVAATATAVGRCWTALDQRGVWP